MVGVFDVVMVMNMDFFVILVVGGVDIMFLIVGDFFNGNDVVIFKDVEFFESIVG